MPVFRAQTHLPHPPDTVFAWHERPGAFERLTPPWVDVSVLEREGGIEDGARVVLRIRKGPLDVKWELRHRDYEAGRQFRDEQVSGPLESWVHTHRFVPAEDGGTRMEDEVEWQPPLGSAGELFAVPAVHRELEKLFAFRHRRIRSDLDIHARYGEAGHRTVAISGASGLIGTALTHLLTTGGHTVLPMVRRKGEADAGTVYWNVDENTVDRDALEPADAVVHLAGEPIFGIRWTAAKKRAIRESRVQGTELIARTMAGLHDGPDTLVSGSAVGYYGGRGDEILTESSRPGTGFLAEVCTAWEAATDRARRSGVRVAISRTGMVLSSGGGALDAMLAPFRMGLGGRLGSGRQYVPWIDLDDVTGILYHAVMNPEVEGPLNTVAPHPVPQARFADALGDVLGRPTVIPAPAFAIKAALGEMGSELLLKGQRAKPERTLESGYRFLVPDLRTSLRFQVGKSTLGGNGEG